MNTELQLQTNDKQLRSLSSEISQRILIYLTVTTTVQITWCWGAGCSVCNELQWNECIKNWPWPNIGLCSRICMKKYVEMCKTPIMTACLGPGIYEVTSAGVVPLTMRFGSYVLFLWLTNKFTKSCNAGNGKVSLCICGHTTYWATNHTKRWRQKKNKQCK
jgi:hypothetical protein